MRFSGRNIITSVNSILAIHLHSAGNQIKRKCGRCRFASTYFVHIVIKSICIRQLVSIVSLYSFCKLPPRRLNAVDRGEAHHDVEAVCRYTLVFSNQTGPHQLGLLRPYAINTVFICRLYVGPQYDTCNTHAAWSLSLIMWRAIGRVEVTWKWLCFHDTTAVCSSTDYQTKSNYQPKPTKTDIRSTWSVTPRAITCSQMYARVAVCRLHLRCRRRIGPIRVTRFTKAFARFTSV